MDRGIYYKAQHSPSELGANNSPNSIKIPDAGTYGPVQTGLVLLWLGPILFWSGPQSIVSSWFNLLSSLDCTSLCHGLPHRLQLYGKSDAQAPKLSPKSNPVQRTVGHG